MGLKLTEAVRNALLDGLDATFNSGTLELRSGAPPSTAAAAPTGTLIASIALPADWADPASGGSKDASAALEDLSADNAGTLGYFLLKTSSDTGAASEAQARITGTITATGGGGDMEVDNTVVASGQDIQVTSFTLTQPAS